MTKFYSGITAALFGAATIVSVQITAASALEPTQISEAAQKFTVMITGDCEGSGVLIERQGENYTVLTANHVVTTTGECFIQTPDGMRYKFYETRPVSGAPI
jgi:hypothetical protein